MTNSAFTSRAALLAKSRKHFVGFALSSIVLTGALATYTATNDSLASTAGSTTSSDDNSTGSTADQSPGGDSFRSGVTSSGDEHGDDDDDESSRSSSSESTKSGSSTPKQTQAPAPQGSTNAS